MAEKKTSSQQDYDSLFKVIIVGTTAVGKSSVLIRYADDEFNSTFVSTIGESYKFDLRPSIRWPIYFYLLDLMPNINKFIYLYIFSTNCSI